MQNNRRINLDKKKIYIFGASGFAKEVYSICIRTGWDVVAFVDRQNNNQQIYGVPVISENEYDPTIPVVLAFGKPSLRKTVFQFVLSKNFDTQFPTLIDPSVIMLNRESIQIGSGSIICAGSILTCDIELGIFSNINLNTTIGHDCKLGDFFTTAPLVSISGKTTIDNNVYFGCSSSCHENINIVKDVTIGMGGVVVKDISESGTYVGVPVKKIK
jgi:sugar O-acyltransferase (sialic acid O-acetyltransferase NeuD family)